LGGQLTVRQALARVREATLDIYAHQDLPFEKLVEGLKAERHPGVTPLFQVMFVLQNTPGAPLDLPGLRLASREVARGAALGEPYLALEDGAGGIRGLLEFDPDLFDDATIGRMLTHFEQALAAMAGDRERQLLALELLGQAERQQLLVEWNDSE